MFLYTLSLVEPFFFAFTFGSLYFRVFPPKKGYFKKKRFSKTQSMSPNTGWTHGWWYHVDVVDLWVLTLAKYDDLFKVGHW